MGRTILLVVIMVTTIYAGIIISVQREMYKLPEIIKDNFSRKEIENVSDYALRAAVRLGTERPEFRIPYGDSILTCIFDGNTAAANHFPIYRQYHNGVYYDIKNIRYTRTKVAGPDFYEAAVTIERPLQTPYDESYTYNAQIGYDYYDPIIDGPLILYGDYGAQFHTPEIVEDTSPQIPPTEGYLFGLNDDQENNIKLESKGVWGNGSGHKCFYFGHGNNHPNGKNDAGAGIQVPNPLLDSLTYALLINRLKCYDQFTVSCYAKVKRVDDSSVNEETSPYGTTPFPVQNINTTNGNCGTLMWFASNPYQSLDTEPGYTRPSIAMWYDSYRTTNPNRYTVTMHYGVTIDNPLFAGGVYREITKTAVPTYPHNQIGNGDWHMFTMTFLNGTLTAYYDGDMVGSLNALYNTIKPNDYGLTIGIRDIRSDGLCPTQYKEPGTNYMFFNGLMDYYSYWDVALTPDQIEDWYNQTIGRTVKHYIRD